MSPHRATPAGETTPGTAIPPSPGFDAAWHPVLGRMLHGRRRRQLLDRRHPWLLDTATPTAQGDAATASPAPGPRRRP
ncbi:hypothetical protein E4N62_24040 [Streptomyces sp. MNU76]|uniref:hypothetical protein n=1 Tax=Streptomyces sp. MNU76 TaxID=2560026 RepID=UPI001E3E7295|nr:hypothetical protein [Streptomyces sp. MNU76]MCC9708056.1 hypothetical protein [Streptomyces sp. MNU76]